VIAIITSNFRETKCVSINIETIIFTPWLKAQPVLVFNMTANW
jgi:hypothetical protein